MFSQKSNLPTKDGKLKKVYLGNLFLKIQQFSIFENNSYLIIN